MKNKSSTSFRMVPAFLALVLAANMTQAAVTLLGSGTLSGPDLSGLTGTLEDGTAENQLGTGSGIAYAGYGNRFFVIPDRGPNASTYNPAVDNTTSYISRTDEVDVGIAFNGTNWVITPSLVKTTLFKNATALTGTATTSNPSKLYFTGLSSGFDATNSSNSMRFDPEGIRLSKTGNSVFVTDEYGPFVYEFDRNTGTRIRSIPVPAKFNIANPNQLGATEISSNTSGRVTNKGMEGLAISPDGSKLYGIMQSPLLQDNALTAGGSKLGIYCRILEIDVATGATKEYVYPLSNKSYTVSEIVAINDHEFLVDERDGNGGTSAVKKTFYKIDITGATDVSAVASLPASGAIPSVTTVTKSASPFLDMLNPVFGLVGVNFPEKIEGIAFGPDLPDGRHTLVITNDNDFTAYPNTFWVFAVDAADLNYVPQSVAVTGPSSSQSPYLVKSQSNVTFESILTTGDSVNNKPDGITPYRMVGVPDGLGAFDNGDGTFTVLMNQELTNTQGVIRAHGALGSFVSKWIINKSNLSVVSGSDLIQDVKIWNGSAYVSQAYAFTRFCSADLAATSAFYDTGSSTGYNGRIFMNGEESGAEGKAFAHLMDGTSYELPRLGKFSHENALANPATGLSTVVVSLDDTSPAGQVYVYAGTKTNSGSPVDKAGLTNGNLYGIKLSGINSEVDATTLPGPVAFTAYSFGDVSGMTGAQLETANGTNVTSFQRPEDGAWDVKHPNDFYFVTTASMSNSSRLWRLRFNDASNPSLGGFAEMLLDGSEGQKMMDNLAVSQYGDIIIQEDPGNNARVAKVWRYNIATDTLTEVGQHDPSRFLSGGGAFITQDEESSGVIDASSILGTGWYLLDVQSHNALGGELVEGGQLLAMHVEYPDTDGDGVSDNQDCFPTNAAQSACPAGSYPTGTGSAQAPAGSYASNGLLALCNVGSFTSTSGNSSCTAAPAGGYVSTTGATGITQCAAGTYNPNTGSVSSGACVQTPAGSYSGAGAAGPTACAVGTYQPVAGQSSCIAATTCSVSEYESTAPTTITNRVCSASTTCTASQYESTALTATSDRVCSLRKQNDFSPDGKADVLLRNTTSGQFFLSTQNGLTVLNQGVVGAFSDLENVVVSTADLDGNGTADILTRGTVNGVLPGAFHIDLVSGQNVIGSAWMNTMSTDLNDVVMSTKDFNKDGKADVLLRNTLTGVWTINYMNGTSAPTIGTLNASTDLCYTMQGDGDYDGNGYPDILLRKDHCGGASYPWLVYTTNGTPTVLASGTATGVTMNIGWAAMATDKDFNGDGKSDILMRDRGASPQLWLEYDMNGVGAPLSSGQLPIAVQSMWQLAADADFNGDGKADLLIRSVDTGQWFAYLMNDRAVLGSGAIGMEINPIWNLQGLDDNNGDGKTDILLRNNAGGAWYLYLMNGVTISSKAILPLTYDLGYTLQND